MTYPPQPPFLMYVMWHPDSDDAASVADRIREHFQSPRFRHVAGGESMEVLFRSARSPDAPPFDVAWDAPCPVAVVVMVDDAVAGDAEWVRYVRGLGARAEREGPRARMIPVLMEPSVLDRMSLDEQAIRWDRWNDATEERAARLLRDLTYECCRMLRYHLDQSRFPNEDASNLERYLDKVRVFLSHSKHDAHGSALATEIRRWLNANTALSSFLDAPDIPAGLRAAQVIEHYVGRSVMLAIYTDSYSSREWCRREVIAAKRHGVPMVVADCLQEGDDRAFPYLGNVPFVRMNPMSRDRIPRVIARLLDEVLRGMLWQSRVEALRPGETHPIFLTRPPEFASLASQGLDPGRQSLVVHPDPPLGNEEKTLLASAWSGLRLLSMNQWLAEMQ